MSLYLGNTLSMIVLYYKVRGSDRRITIFFYPKVIHLLPAHYYIVRTNAIYYPIRCWEFYSFFCLNINTY